MNAPRPSPCSDSRTRRRTRRGWLLIAALLLAGVAPAGKAGPSRAPFDHLTTGFELVGLHRDLPCESCHANAMFKGTPKSCGACHGVGTVIRATAKPSSHILTTDLCGACHTPIAWKPAVDFDHTQTRGSCSSCHNGVQAQGKGATHLVTDLECDACHTTLSWNGAVFTHQGVTSGCARCHTGVAATGLPATHIPVGTTGCEGCHSNTNFLTWAGTRINHTAVTALTCQSCHETASYLGMHPSTGTTAGDSRPPATLDANHPKAGDCGQCHDTTSFGNSALRPANHIPTNAPCAQCHTTPGDYALYSVTGTHQGVATCLSCHAPSVAGSFANITITTQPGSHIPTGGLDCGSSGCHTANKVTSGGFRLGAANPASPTLGVAGHGTVAAAVAACQSCHEAAGFLGMQPSSATSAGDSRPAASLDAKHPASGDCGGCHTTTPTFAGNVTGAGKPANHIPTNAPCGQCHTTAGNYALYSVTGTHQGVTSCLSCHGPTVATSFANITLVTLPGNHVPIGGLDCNGSGCHTITNVNAGGFRLGAANPAAPTLSVAGHTTVAAAVAGCQSCHEAAPYLGMLTSTASTAGDSRPGAALDAKHPTSGDCGGCHTTTPTFGTDQTAGAKPANHIPTSATCAQCHTTAGNYVLYSVTATHLGVTACLSCHGPTVATSFANITLVTTPGNHIPTGTLDCNGSGCHTTTNVGAGGFRLGAANPANPTLSVPGHATVLAAVAACQTCHTAASYLGMQASTATAAGDSRPSAALDSLHPTSGDCGGCHTTAPTFAANVVTGTKPAGHIPTSAPCAQCHFSPSNFASYSVTGTHQGVSGCLTCHGPAVATTFTNVTIVSTPGTHMPIGGLDCNGSGCHTTTSVSTGGFRLGAASISAPTLNVSGHTTVATAVASCKTCHESAPYLGMLASTATAAGDSRPTALDKAHPSTGDCNGCHTTTPTFATDQTGGSTKPANHIPTTAACAQCHPAAGNYALYSVSGTHQGVTTCLGCHAASVAGTFANITIASPPANHMPIGNLDCNGSGCHTLTNLNTGGFRLGAANLSTPTLNVAGHSTVAAAVSGCQSCHESAPYVGMLASTATTPADSRPMAFDKAHPGTGDCNGCHTTTPTFSKNQTAGAKPANHIPTTAACTQCHTTAGNYSAYSVPGVHQGVTKCLACHAPSVAGTFANVTIATTPANHIPIGTLDCNGGGCHATTQVNVGGFRLGAASLSTPTLTIPGHATVAKAISGCQTCHESAPYAGMLASTATAAGDSRPTALDKSHPTTGDCSGCHTTTPTFSTNQTGASAKPANHIPTSAPCGQCHTTAGNYGVYVMGATGHQGIASNCARCHAYGLSFYNMAPPTLKEPASGATGHIPAVPPNGAGGFACELCHSPSAFSSFAGTVMKHAVVRSMKCTSCHEDGMRWQTNSGAQLWVRPGPDHNPGQDCGGSGCHSTRDKFAVRLPHGTTTATALGRTRPGITSTPPGAAAHSAGEPAARQPRFEAGASSPLGVGLPAGIDPHSVTGKSCASCHTGARGKPPDHMPTGDACGSCHRTHAWMPVAMVDHLQVRGACVGCHTGRIAKGKASGHLPTSGACESCHTSNAWTPARVDHGAVMPHSCASCHNAVRAIGLPRAHIPTTQTCDSCHGTLAWLPAKVDHAGLTASCNGCHNNANATGRPVGHMDTHIDCGRCHSYPDWDSVHFRHVSVAYPGDHRGGPACAGCHTSGTERVPYPSPSNAGACAGCHAKDFKPAAHKKTVKGDAYGAGELANCSGACHVYSDSTQATIMRSQPGPRHRVSDATFKH